MLTCFVQLLSLKCFLTLLAKEKTMKLTQKLAFAAATLVLAASASAAVGSASATDVVLHGDAADAFAYQAGWNPNAGPNGDTSGFGTAFDAFGSGSWSLLDKYSGGSGLNAPGDLSFTFAQITGTNGIWSVTNTSSTGLVLDLAFAVHAGAQAGAWLFDGQTVQAGQTLAGTWDINWTVGQGQGNNPNFSNLTLFAREVSPVPEPATYGMLLAGMAVVGMVARRRKQG